MYYKVIDDFLPEQNLISLYNSILSNKVKWSFSDSVASRSDTSGFYFNSVFFELINTQSNLYTTTGSNGNVTTHDIKNVGPHPDVFKEILIILNKVRDELNPWAKSLFRIRACLYIKSDDIIEHAFHIDAVDIEHIAVIFYLNDNNGYTRLKIDDKIIKIESKQNRLLIMDGEIEHASSTCTDNDMRAVINFNFTVN